MAEIGSAFLTIAPSAKGFGSSAQRQIAPQMNSVAKKTGSRFGKVFATATISPLRAIGAAAIGLFAVKKVKDFFAGAINEARESQKVSAITAQVIKSTGGAANISADQVGKLAGNISKLTGIDDEAIQAGSNLLLTFTNLRNEAGKGNDVFNQATKIITDMSVALGTDVKGSAIQVGKALNDPIKGISALTRVGVAFTEQQKDQITKLTESGKRLAAQKIILGELRKEFGGTAAAAATAGDRFRTTFANFQEVIGLALLPYLDRLLDKGTAVLNFLMVQVPPAFASFKASIEPVAAVIGTFVNQHLPAFQTALAALGGSALTSVISLIGGGLFTALTVLVGALTSPIALVGALAGAAVYAYFHFENFRTSVNNLAAFMQANVVPALVAFGNTLRNDVLPIAIQFGTWLATKGYPAAIQFWTAVGQKLLPALTALGQTIKTDVAPAVQALGRELQQHQPAIQKTAQLVIRLEAAYGTFSSSMLGKVLPAVIKVTGFLIGSHLSAVASVIDIVFDWISALGKLGGALKKAASAVGDFVSSVRSKVALMVGIGKDLIAGLVNGIKSAGGAVIDALGGIVDSAISAAKKKLHIGSPSKVFHQIGQWTMEGFANGIDTAGPKVLKSMETALDKVIDKATQFRDGIKSNLDAVLSDFRSLKDSIASTFAGGLFDVAAIAPNLTDTVFTAGATVGQAFLDGLRNKKTQLKELLGAFKKLKHWGIPPSFLSQLFASGNTDLILELASGRRSQAVADAGLFSDVQSLSNQLGGQVARNQYGPQLTRLENRLDRANDHLKHLDHLARDIAKALNDASAKSQREPKGAAA